MSHVPKSLTANLDLQMAVMLHMNARLDPDLYRFYNNDIKTDAIEQQK